MWITRCCVEKQQQYQDHEQKTAAASRRGPTGDPSLRCQPALLVQKQLSMTFFSLPLLILSVFFWRSHLNNPSSLLSTHNIHCTVIGDGDFYIATGRNYKFTLYTVPTAQWGNIFVKFQLLLINIQPSLEQIWLLITSFRIFFFQKTQQSRSIKYSSLNDFHIFQWYSQD